MTSKVHEGDLVRIVRLRTLEDGDSYGSNYTSSIGTIRMVTEVGPPSATGDVEDRYYSDEAYNSRLFFYEDEIELVFTV